VFEAILACPVLEPQTYRFPFGIVLILLMWGVVIRGRAEVTERRGLGVLAAIGWSGTIAYVLIDRRVDTEEAWLALLRAASFTTGCVYLEIFLSPRCDHIPSATIVRRR
jgi:hypothetical protein